jgi:hypothetical protein
MGEALCFGGDIQRDNRYKTWENLIIYMFLTRRSNQQAHSTVKGNSINKAKINYFRDSIPTALICTNGSVHNNEGTTNTTKK